jgi:DNA-binding NtrC family response regulator
MPALAAPAPVVIPLPQAETAHIRQPEPQAFVAIPAQPIAPGAYRQPVASQSGEIAATDGHGHLRPLHEIESEVIRLALEHYRGHMSEVARRLGIGRSTLYRKVRELGLEKHAAEG